MITHYQVSPLFFLTQSTFQIIHGNALEVSSSLHALAPLIPKDSSSPLHIMGNLPFNVASPLLIQWLHQSAAREGLFKLGDVWMTLMFQKEVGEVKITKDCLFFYSKLHSSVSQPHLQHNIVEDSLLWLNRFVMSAQSIKSHPLYLYLVPR